MGSWVTYGLDSEADDLPAFVVLPDPRGRPPGGIIDWGAGFLAVIAKKQRTRGRFRPRMIPVELAWKTSGQHPFHVRSRRPVLPVRSH